MWSQRPSSPRTSCECAGQVNLLDFGLAKLLTRSLAAGMTVVASASSRPICRPADPRRPIPHRGRRLVLGLLLYRCSPLRAVRRPGRGRARPPVSEGRSSAELAVRRSSRAWRTAAAVAAREECRRRASPAPRWRPSPDRDDGAAHRAPAALRLVRAALHLPRPLPTGLPSKRGLVVSLCAGRFVRRHRTPCRRPVARDSRRGLVGDGVRPSAPTANRRAPVHRLPCRPLRRLRPRRNPRQDGYGARDPRRGVDASTRACLRPPARPPHDNMGRV